MSSNREVIARVEKGRTDIPTKCHSDCETCIAGARKKYNNFTADDGAFYEDGFGIDCSYIPASENFVDSKLRDMMTPGDWEEVNARRSALLWGEKYLVEPENGLPWKAWPYQRGPLLCRSSRKVYRFGRRCLPAGVPILMGDGSWRPIESVKPGEYVASRNSKAQFVQKRILNFWENGDKDIYRITLSNGMWLDCTSNHPLFTYILRDEINKRGVLKRWISIDDGLKKGMKVCVLNQFDRWGKESHKELGPLLGYLLTDGYIVGGTQTPKFTNNNRLMIDEVRTLSQNLFGYDCSTRPKGNGWDIYITDGDKGTPNKLSAELKKLGLLGLKSAGKVIPSWIFDWDKESTMLFVNRLFSGDGGLYYHQKKDRPKGEFAVEANLSSTSRQMLDQVRLILLKVGVVGFINKDGNPDEEKGHTQSWKFRISSRDSLCNFFKHVGLIYGKEDRCLEVLEALKNKTRGPKGVYKHQKFVAIRSIEPIGTQPTYDIEVEDTHNLVSNGICSHNTGKCLTYTSDVHLHNGSIRKIGDLIGKEVTVNSLNLENYQYVTSKAFVCDNGVKPCVRIITRYGQEIECTLNHPLLTCDGWQSVDTGLQVGDRIAVPIKNPNIGTETFDKEQLNLLGKESRTTNKSIPDFVFCLDAEHIEEFLKSLFVIDEKNISCCFSSKDLAVGVRRLLARLGIITYIRVETLEGRTSYCITEVKNENLDTNLYWDEIVSIEDLGEVPTAGLQVPEHHNYVNDVVEHNTTILAVEILWYLFTAGGGTVRDATTNSIRNNIKVLLLAPQKSHVENIFDRIRAFLATSPALGACIDRNKRGSPQKITLVTESGIGEGSAISGFASGDSSGSKGLSARGQDADLIILDEGAYISLEAIEGVVISILATRPDTRFIISSTPSGLANDYFENICTKRPDFTEFYVPMTQRPDWEMMAGQMAKEFGSSSEQYDKEVLAAFSPAGIGVYREDLVRLAQAEYKYGQAKPNGAFVYTIGVDWNKEHGTEIAIVGTQKAEPHISYIVGVENISKKENTSPRGISRIVELNKIWNPMWIYVDMGGGDGGQMLRYHGRSMVGKNILEARLKDIVIDYDFGSKQETTEHDGTINKVPSKQFLVENSVKKFELGEIKYPREDLNITRQLNNYIVVRRQLSGVPVYGTKEAKWGDHTLDAINLALVAIRLQLPSFQHAKISPMGVPIAFIPNAPDPRQNERPRIILPASASSSMSGRHIPRHQQQLTNSTVVRYWGTEPSEDAVARNYQRGGVPFRKKIRYGR